MFSRINLTLVLGFAVAGLLLATAGIAPASANLIQNGGFDNPSSALATRVQGDGSKETGIDNGTNDGVNAGDMPYWTVYGTLGSYDGHTGPGFAQYVYTGEGNLPASGPQSGNYALYLRGGYGDYVQQTFAVTAGYTYSFSVYSERSTGNVGNNNGTADFYASLIPDLNAGTLTGSTTGSAGSWTLTGSGTNASPLTGEVAPATNAWVQYSCTFSPTGTGTVLMKLSNTKANPNYNSPELDTVDVEQIAGVPEPGTLALLAAGLAGLLCYAWRKRK